MKSASSYERKTEQRRDRNENNERSASAAPCQGLTKRHLFGAESAVEFQGMRRAELYGIHYRSRIYSRAISQFYRIAFADDTGRQATRRQAGSRQCECGA